MNRSTTKCWGTNWRAHNVLGWNFSPVLLPIVHFYTVDQPMTFTFVNHSRSNRVCGAFRLIFLIFMATPPGASISVVFSISSHLSPEAVWLYGVSVRLKSAVLYACIVDLFSDRKNFLIFRRAVFLFATSGIQKKAFGDTFRD